MPLQTSESMIPLQTSDNMIPRFSVEVVIVFSPGSRTVDFVSRLDQVSFSSRLFSIKRFGLPIYNLCAIEPLNLAVTATLMFS